jgi:hypothetical protein
MVPTGEALEHPAAPLLLELATVGCRADVGEGCTLEMLDAAILKGSHPSAMEPEAAAQLRKEALEKVGQGYARLVQWAELRRAPPKNLKISPIAAIDALQDFSTLIKVLGRQATHCCKLMEDPGYICYCNASKLGAGGSGYLAHDTSSPSYGGFNGRKTSASR